MSSPSDLLTIAEVSVLSGMDATWLRRLCVAGKLPARKAGTVWLVQRRDLAALQGREPGRVGRRPTA